MVVVEGEEEEQLQKVERVGGEQDDGATLFQPNCLNCLVSLVYTKSTSTSQALLASSNK